MLASVSMPDAQYNLTSLDRKLVQLTQAGLPLVPQPYLQLANELDISVDEVKARFKRMLELGIIRRIAAVPNHYALGFRANGMTVWDVPDELVSQLGKQIGDLDFVSHCYHRPRHLPDWPYNLFAMVHGKSQDDVSDHIDQIRNLIGEDLRSNNVLFSTKILKKTGLRIKSE